MLISVSAAQLRPAVQDAGSPRFTSSVNLVKVPISVFDSKGSMVDSLQRESFRIWEDQSPQEIRSFGKDSNSVSVVLVVDTSGSTGKELKIIKAAANEFTNALDREDSISVLSFNDEVYRVLDWTQDKNKAKKALGKLRPGITTALYDAMYLAASEQLKDIEGRKAIVLLTDCVNHYSLMNFSDAELAITQSQASLYVISKTAMFREVAKRARRAIIIKEIYEKLFGKDENYIDELFDKKEAEMSGLAEKTGGRCFFPIDYAQIDNVYMDIVRELKSQYYLTYISNQNLPPNSYHRIAVEYLGSASKVLYRKGYYYLPQRVAVTRFSTPHYGSLK